MIDETMGLEVYYSVLHGNEFGNWMRHTKNTCRLYPLEGSIQVSFGHNETTIMEPHTGDFVTIPPGQWYAFKKISHHQAVILNIMDGIYDESEVEIKTS